MGRFWSSWSIQSPTTEVDYVDMFLSYLPFYPCGHKTNQETSWMSYMLVSFLKILTKFFEMIQSVARSLLLSMLIPELWLLAPCFTSLLQECVSVFIQLELGLDGRPVLTPHVKTSCLLPLFLHLASRITDICRKRTYMYIGFL